MSLKEMLQRYKTKYILRKKLKEENKAIQRERELVEMYTCKNR